MSEFTEDTELSNAVVDYLRIAKAEGFRVVLEFPFTGTGWDHVDTPETLYVLFHDADGVLLVFDTFGTDHVNGGHFYYNWLPNPQYPPSVTSSGGFRRYGDGLIWSGDHDCREDLRANLSRLRQHGRFVTPWPAQPFLWLLHYMDTKKDGYDFRKISDSRFAILPPDVLSAIGATA